jgi:hypothetical protein
MPADSLEKSADSSAAKSGSVEAVKLAPDAELEAIIAAWPMLSPNLRRIIAELAGEIDGR